MARDEPQVNLRMPAELKAALESSASNWKRSLTSEIVARLQDSFVNTSGEDAALSEKLLAMDGELEQQRALTAQFREVADSSDSIRALLAVLLLSLLKRMPKNTFESDMDEHFYQSIAEWLSERDPRGAAFSVLNLVDGRRPEIVELLQNFTSHLEDLDLVRKPFPSSITKKKPQSKKPSGSQ